jgi:hypothetical protein
MWRPDIASSLNQLLTYNSIEELFPQPLAGGVNTTTVNQLTSYTANEVVRNELEQCKQTTFLFIWLSAVLCQSEYFNCQMPAR